MDCYNNVEIEKHFSIFNANHPPKLILSKYLGTWICVKIKYVPVREIYLTADRDLIKKLIAEYLDIENIEIDNITVDELIEFRKKYQTLMMI